VSLGGERDDDIFHQGIQAPDMYTLSMGTSYKSEYLLLPLVLMMIHFLSASHQRY
jgi:hypothetical protein